MDLIRQIESQNMKKELPAVRVGDTVKVHMRISEGEKERIQMIEGLVIAMRGTGIRKSITVRKISFGVGVERAFPLHSPKVEKIEVVKRSRVRKAKLYFLRDLKGKAARLKDVRKALVATASAPTAAAAPATEAAGEAAPAKSKDKGGKKKKAEKTPA